MPWKPAALSDLEREKHALQMAVLKLRQQLETKQQYAGRLEVLLHQRTETIDAQRATIDRLRDQNKQLESEAEHYADMIRIMPQLDPAMLAPK